MISYIPWILLFILFLLLVPLAAIGGMFLVMVGKPSKYDNLVGTNRFNRMKIVFLAAKHPEMFVKGFPNLSKDIKETPFAKVILGRVNNYDKHLKESQNTWADEQGS